MINKKINRVIKVHTNPTTKQVDLVITALVQTNENISLLKPVTRSIEEQGKNETNTGE